MSVPSDPRVQATFCATLFDEWTRSGLTDVVICPGSRSTPLALAAARAGVRLHVRLDERSAGFFALGVARATGRPVAVVVTSGTAAAELHACVAEADQAFVPLLIVTADRPARLRGVGAPQTIDQRELFGPMVRDYEDPGVPQMEHSAHWRELANRLWAAAQGVTHFAGPVHLNAAFDEPLVGEPDELPEGRDGNRPWQPTVATHPERADLAVGGRRVLCVVGAGATPDMVRRARASHWVVLGDVTAQGTTAHFDAVLRDVDLATALRPDLVVRLGGLPASKVLGERLRTWGSEVVGLDGAGFVADPERVVSRVVPGAPDHESPSLAGESEYAALWARVSEAAARAASSHLEGKWNEPVVARATVDAASRHGASLVVGSSMPVRDVEWWGAPRTTTTHSNRGVNGIDGVVSTVMGVATGGPTIGYVGDLTFLHDVSGLVEGVRGLDTSVALVVSDNRGGAIFNFLPQATALDHDRFEELFGTPRDVDIESVARGFGHEALTVHDEESLRVALDGALGRRGLTVIVAAMGDRRENVAVHDELNQICIAAARAALT